MEQKQGLATIGKKAKAAWGIVKSLGPFALSQSQNLSEAYADHQLRLAKVDAAKEAMIQEITMCIKIRESLVTKYYELPPEQRILRMRDINEIDRQLNRLKVYTKAIDELPNDEDGSHMADSEYQNISPHWLDKFDELARQRNEDWREQLLANALAKESLHPNCIGTRALWMIGTLEENMFHSYASILDISVRIGGRNTIPNIKSFYESKVPSHKINPAVSLGGLCFDINELGLYGDLLTSSLIYQPNEKFIASYGDRTVYVTPKNGLKIPGMILTPLGQAIACLYNSKPNELGREVFSQWVTWLKEQQCEVINFSG